MKGDVPLKILGSSEVSGSNSKSFYDDDGEHESTWVVDLMCDGQRTLPGK